jgi:hypothetical protein
MCFRPTHVLRHLAVLVVIGCLGLPAHAVNTTWTGSASSDFFTDGNWDNSAPDTAAEIAYIVGGANQPAIVDASTGTVTLGGFNLGVTGAGGGQVVQNGGTLVVAADTSGEESNISGAAAANSSWIMSGNSVILYDDPLGGGGDGLGSDGTGKDFDVGDSDSGNAGILELHDDAALRISDDLKIADNGSNAAATILLDGNAEVSVGSGTSIGANGPAELTIAGSALYVSGNSAGPGNSAEGRTNEGYLAMHQANITVKESGRLYVRTLQHRGGTSTVTVQDDGQFHIFEAFSFAAPDLGVATVVGDATGNQRTSEVAEGETDEMTITLRNNGVMTVDVDIDDSPWSGLALSGGTNQGGNGAGGTTLVDVYDSANFTVQQNLNMTMGTSPTASSTLKVHGPDATVAINGDLRMDLEPDGNNDVNGTAVIHAVITASRHSTVQIGGDALIANGDLIVELDGYTPVGGETYLLLSSGNQLAEQFASFDASAAPLTDPLQWDLEYSGNDVLLHVLGTTTLLGDVNLDGEVNGLDVDPFVDVLLNGPYQREADMNGDDVVNGLDVDPFVATVVGGGAQQIPEPATLLLALVALGMVLGASLFSRLRGVHRMT